MCESSCLGECDVLGGSVIESGSLLREPRLQMRLRVLDSIKTSGKSFPSTHPSVPSFSAQIL